MQAFKDFLLGHICLQKRLRKDTFFLGEVPISIHVSAAHTKDRLDSPSEVQVGQLENFAKSMQNTVQALGNQVHDHAHMMKHMQEELESAWKVKQKTIEMEAERSRKEWQDFRTDNKRHFERIKDAFGLLNEAQSRTSKQVMNIAGEVGALTRLKESVVHNGQVISEVRQAYVEVRYLHGQGA
ncbi:hypothetical protein DYB36_003247 [Aphanomyces astaci]|uniref:DUF4200 domain-containing protein n=1 Tax=Aphanomyces astaci TaxID=112090 RepID=A0A397AZV2_APHAT|nr:hypothetical protein DYB36_003247 [Aphanomyces astaci]